MGEKQILWPGWETVRLIGHGSFGAVYEIERDVFGHKEKAALKAITLPQSSCDIEELYDSGYDEASITATFESHLKSIVNEYSLMREMNGAANVVNCDDFRIVQHDDGIGWDIYIKMELLTPLSKALDKRPDDEQVIRIAKDMCSALILCRKYGIIHRDIKPQNIFVSKNGDYKLGDFGIAKTIEKTSGGTKIGTYKYMAPEVYNNQPYNLTADIYSLGLVMHWMLNERRSPFMPLPPAPAVASQEEEARIRRFRGEPIPAPVHGSEALKRIVLKACAYDPNDRYQSADEMLRELNALGAPASASAAQPVADDSRFVETAEEDNATVGAWAAPAAAPENADDDATESTVGAWSARAKPAGEETTQAEERTVGVWDRPEAQKSEPAPAPKKPKKKWWLSAFAVVVAVTAVAGALGTLAGSLGTINPPDAAITPELETPAIRTPAPEASIVAISAGLNHTVGLKPDGTVVAVGSNNYQQIYINDWKDIVKVSAGHLHTVGLKSDGTVVAVGYDIAGQCRTSAWEDIVEVSAGYYHTVGLKSDGTVVATGYNSYGQCDVSDWTDIVAVSAGYYHTVGLNADGTVVATGDDASGQCDVSSWKNIVAISAGGTTTVGLKSDGTVVTAGDNSWGQRYISSWKNIVAVSAGYYHTVGLKSDGTVVAVGSNSDHQCNVSDWNDIIAISAGFSHTVGLKSDGTAVAIGYNKSGQCNVSDW